MKKTLLVIFTSLLFISCTTPKFLVLNDNKYQSHYDYHEVVILSKANDFFKVYKINDRDYAFLPYKASDKGLNLDDIPNCIIITDQEYEEFKNSLQNFINSCQNNKNRPFFTELVVRDITRIQTITTETSDLESKTNIKDPIKKLPFLLQATSRRNSSNRDLKITSYSNINNKKYLITLNDVNNLLLALSK